MGGGSGGAGGGAGAWRLVVLLKVLGFFRVPGSFCLFRSVGFRGSPQRECGFAKKGGPQLDRPTADVRLVIKVAASAN